MMERFTMNKKHYSYILFKNREYVKNFDRIKFGDDIGSMMLENEKKILYEIIDKNKILDIGAGTGRLSIPLIEYGADVVLYDASREMLRFANEKALNKDFEPNLIVGDAHNLPFRDKSFEHVLAFRILMHLVNWKMTLSEICRVSNNYVVLDFPPRCSIILFAPLYFFVLRVKGVKVEKWKSFYLHSIKKELNKNGFKIVKIKKNFLLPIFLHRIINNIQISQKLESIFLRSKITYFLGSQNVIIAKDTSQIRSEKI